MLVRFTTTENHDNTSPLLLKASNRLASHIRACRLNGLDNSNIHMVHGRMTGDCTFEFVWAFGHFNIEEIQEHVGFPELLTCEAFCFADPTRSPGSSRPSIIANVGRIVDATPVVGVGDGRDEDIPF